MQNIAAWLADLEQLASDFYYSAASHFSLDPLLKAFLNQMAEDEATHCMVMRKAVDCFGNQDSEALITLDNHTREAIEAPLHEATKMLACGELDRRSILDCILHTEFSEWNDLFAYVVQAMVERDRQCIPAAADIQKHRRMIERFFEDLPDGQVYLHSIRNLPRAWEENILVVDDFIPFTGLAKAVLQHEGRIETAVNGVEALQKTEEQYFALILSDVDMPEMDGMQFFREASARYPGIANRFLFMTGNVTPGTRRFF